MMKTMRLGIEYHFDLIAIFNDLNQRFFHNTIKASIRFGQLRKSKHKYSIRLGSYHHIHKAITIHPSLNQPLIPLICVERIIFHEMLHQYLPMKKGPKGKMLIHYPEFYAFEQKYPYLKEADRWLKTNLITLLTY